jgi:hypothetical protein
MLYVVNVVVVADTVQTVRTEERRSTAGTIRVSYKSVIYSS